MVFSALYVFLSLHLLLCGVKFRVWQGPHILTAFVAFRNLVAYPCY